MSSDETFLREVMLALDRVGLEALVVGTVDFEQRLGSPLAFFARFRK